MAAKQLPILSVDAYNAGGSWQWNNWHKVGTISANEFDVIATKGEKAIAVWMRDNGYTTTADMRKIRVEDDEYNIVICGERGRPLFAIEYGDYFSS